MDLEHERRLTEVETRSKSNSRRLDELERDTQAVQSLATSVAVMAEKMDTMNTSLTNMSKKVEAIESEPAKKWRFVVEKTIYMVVAAAVGFFLARFGL